MFPRVFSASLQELVCSVLGRDLFLTPGHLGERWGLRKHFQLQYLEGNFCLFLPLYLFLPEETMDLDLVDESWVHVENTSKQRRHFNSTFRPLEDGSNFQQCFICKGGCYAFLIIYGCMIHTQGKIMPFCMSLPLQKLGVVAASSPAAPAQSDSPVSGQQHVLLDCRTSHLSVTSISEVVSELLGNGPAISFRNLVIGKLWACKLLFKGPHLLNSPPNTFCLSFGASSRKIHNVLGICRLHQNTFWWAGSKIMLLTEVFGCRCGQCYPAC